MNFSLKRSSEKGKTKWITIASEVLRNVLTLHFRKKFHLRRQILCCFHSNDGALVIRNIGDSIVSAIC